jgi:hypothetical protein
MLCALSGKKCVGTLSRVWEMAKNTWGRFPECGKWQKIRGDAFPSVGNGKKYVGTLSRVWEMAKKILRRFPECGKWQKKF